MSIDPAIVADEVVLDVLEDASSGSAAASWVTRNDDRRHACCLRRMTAGPAE